MSNTFEADVSGVVCFARGTRIATPRGDVPIETLSAGDNIKTWSGQVYPIRWIGCRKVSEFEMLHSPKLRPIRVRAGALGSQLPKRDLLVSRQHRILVKSKIANRMFDTEEVLIPAIKLVEMAGIEIDNGIKSVDYFHILLDSHEILCADGAPAESLFTGPEALKALPAEALEEISTLFPEIVEQMRASGTAAHVPVHTKVKRLLHRHKKNNRELIYC
ncbi:hypothetical protein TW80_17510 [Loktanella sp. S4079]|nr:hypothetical protein TW80_17510 [Loktanella sp. S4079]